MLSLEDRQNIVGQSRNPIIEDLRTEEGKYLERQRRRKRRDGMRKEIEVGTYKVFGGENEGENKEAVGLAKRVHEEDHQEIGLERKEEFILMNNSEGQFKKKKSQENRKKLLSRECFLFPGSHKTYVMENIIMNETISNFLLILIS